MKNKKHRYKRVILKTFSGLLSGLIILAVVGYIIDYKQRANFVEKTNAEMLSADLSINKSASVIARKDILINAPIEQVWNKLTSIKDWDKWQSSISSTQIDSLPNKGIPFTWTSKGISFHSVIHTNNKFESFGWSGTTWGAQAIHNWYFIGEGNKTKVMVEESLQGLLVDILTDYFQNNLNIGIQISLDELKISCEQ